MRARIAVFASLSVIALSSMSAQAQPTLTLSTGGGHPDIAVTLTGSGFGASEAVDVYVDTTDALLLVTSSAGAFTGSVTIPISAQPGTHYITAIGRRSGDAGQTKFNVTTPWAQQGYGAARDGQNPWENTLNSSNVSQLGLLWATQASDLLAFFGPWMT